MTLTGCLVHGFGVFLYLADEGLPGGANWTIELVPLQQLPLSSLPSLSMKPHGLLSGEAMRSIDRAYAIAQARNRNLPPECLGVH